LFLSWALLNELATKGTNERDCFVGQTLYGTHH